MLASWSDSTLKQYGSAALRWLQYCSDKLVNPYKANINQIIEFMINIFNTTTMQYSSMNTIRSMLSSIVEPCEGITVGSHPLVKRFMKGIFKLRPSLPKYTVTYDAEKVLRYLASLPPSAELSFMDITKRMVTLMAFLSGQRAQTLNALDITCMDVKNESYTFFIPSLLKTSRPSFHQEPLTFIEYPQNQKICVVRNIDEYILRTKELRGDEVRLLISTTAPHHAVTTSTVARWIKDMLHKAGIDVNTFGAHSTRSASTSLARSRGLSVKEIAKAAGWSNSKTFATHYNKFIISNEDDNFGRKIMGN